MWFCCIFLTKQKITLRFFFLIRYCEQSQNSSLPSCLWVNKWTKEFASKNAFFTWIIKNFFHSSLITNLIIPLNKFDNLIFTASFLKNWNLRVQIRSHSNDLIELKWKNWSSLDYLLWLKNIVNLTFPVCT